MNYKDAKELLVNTFGRSEREEDKSCMAGGWYRIDVGGGVVYKAFPGGMKLHLHVGNLDRALTVADQDPNWEIESFSYGIDDGAVLGRWVSSADHREAVDLPAGVYRYGIHEHDNEVLYPFDLRTDRLAPIEDEVHEEIQADLKTFFENEAVYREVGCQYRRGVLFYGPPGNGKTCLVRSVLQEVLPAGAIGIFLDGGKFPSAEFLRKVDEAEAARMKVFVIEEITDLAQGDKNDRRLLDFLDGETSVDKALVLATTNYPERLPLNIVDRPSRFDRLVKIGDPGPNVRRTIMAFYLGRAVSDDDVEAAEGLSLAGLKEAAFKARLTRCTVAEAIWAIRDHSERAKGDFSEKELGFDSGLFKAKGGRNGGRKS